MSHVKKINKKKILMVLNRPLLVLKMSFNLISKYDYIFIFIMSVHNYQMIYPIPNSTSKRKAFAVFK